MYNRKLQKIIAIGVVVIMVASIVVSIFAGYLM